MHTNKATDIRTKKTLEPDGQKRRTGAVTSFAVRTLAHAIKRNVIIPVASSIMVSLVDYRLYPSRLLIIQQMK